MVSAHFFHLLIFRDKNKCEFLLHAGEAGDVDESINPERAIRFSAIQTGGDAEPRGLIALRLF